MSDCYSFRFHEPDDDKRKSLLVYSTSKLSLNDAAKLLKQNVEEHLVPNCVYFMAPREHAISHDDYISDNAFKNEFESYIGDIDTKLICLEVDSTGVIKDISRNVISDGLKNKILHCGMLAIFKKRQGLIVSNHGYHFIKPSGDHCDKFIRASNLLVSSIEVSFLAISLMPYFHDKLKRIYVDTSSISFLASIAIQISGNLQKNQPSIISYESYAALNRRYDFVEDESSLVLVSATTSGSLAKKLLREHNFANDQVVTIFHVNLPSDQKGIFDISKAIDGELTSKNAGQCGFCMRGSKGIRISGDQFLVENPMHEQRIIKKI